MPSQPRITTLAALVYLPLAAVALGWAWHGDRLPWRLEPAVMIAPYPTRLVASVGLGLALGVVVVALTPRLVERFEWARALQHEMKEVVGVLTRGQVLWLALSSGVAEELFFRGAMQPVLGLWFTSLIFGAVHVGPNRVFVAWAAWACVMGVLLGAIFEVTGVLWGAVLAHVWINYRNMRFIQRC